MRRPSSLHAALTAAAVLLAPAVSRADFIFRPNEGWIREGGIFGSSAPTAKTADEQLQIAETLEKKGDLSGAADAYERLIKAFSLSRQVSTARFRLARILDKKGQYERAFESYDEYVAKFPDAPEFNEALEAMFAIAKRYMNGERRRLFGVRTFASNQRAEEMFDAILKRAPYSRNAPRVMLFRGMVLERQGKDAEAVAAYQQIVERFPTDPIADDAQYQLGYIRLRGVKSGSYDSLDRNRAQESFEDFLTRAPGSEKATQARQNLQNIESAHRKSQLEIAKFYEKTGKTKAAALYYRDLIRESPGTPEAQIAQKQIDHLRSTLGEDAVRTGKEPAQNAEKAAARKQMQATINTVSRPDYVGPRLAPESREERAPEGPALRLSPADLAPPSEQVLQIQDPIVNPAKDSTSKKP